MNKSQQPVQQDSEIARHRRISTASSAAATELESSSPEVSSVQNAFLDAIIAGNVMLRRLSPNIDDLVAGNVYDHGQYEQLLRVGFASPAFEQDVSLIIHFLLAAPIKEPSINDVTLIFGVFGPPPPPLSRIHATYQYCLSRFGQGCQVQKF